jgi:C1A family cysteine protease
MEKKYNYKFGWKPQKPDIRDYKYVPKAIVLPSSVDLRSQCPSIYDQGQLGSCVANAVCGTVEFDRIKQGDTDWTPSRLFNYYNTRVIEGTVDYDAGAEIRDSVKSMVQSGDCPETEWPYDISQFTVQPPAQDYTDATKYEALVYQAVNQDETTMKTILASGYPIVVGFTVYNSFYDADTTGIVNMPGSLDYVIGGHAVLVVGYDDSTQRWLCRNSWGTGWGMSGYFTIPYAYFTNTDLASDFWLIQTVSDSPTPTPTPTPTPSNPCATQIKTGLSEIESGNIIQGVEDLVKGLLCYIENGAIKKEEILKRLV